MKKRTMLTLSVTAGVSVALALAAGSVAKPAAASSTPSHTSKPSSSWKLLYQENFTKPLGINSAPWVQQTSYGPSSPWYAQYFGEDGAYYHVIAGPPFQPYINSFRMMRKQVAFGKDGWLTAELAQEDFSKTGPVTGGPTVTETKLANGVHAAVLDETNDSSGVIIRDTRPLPPEYKIEYTLNTINFGGDRNGSLSYNGDYNGYTPPFSCDNSYPWNGSGPYTGPANPCNPNFASSLSENGYYFMYITGFPDAPHDNPVVHDRKVGFDAFNVTGSSLPGYWVCNPKTKQLYPYTSSNRNAINATFSMGNDVAGSSILFPGQLYQTPCGTYTNQDPNTSIVETAELQPELMPKESYTFAIERTATSYCLQMSGDFRYTGSTTITECRKFIQDGIPIWHYNNTAAQYNGQYNASVTDSGQYGSFTIPNIWPKGSAYPDYFVIGDPHINYYEGSATISNIRLYVPQQ